MKKIILLLCIFFLQNQITAQTGADIKDLVKINNIQQSNTNRILLTDGNGNLGYTTFSNLSNAGTVVTTTLNTAVLKTQINQNAKFRNLPDASYNRVVTLDTNGSLGYRTFASLANSTTNLSGTLGLNATNLINLTTNIFSSPTSYTYVVVSDANGTLGKRPLSDFTTQDPNVPCTGWVTTNTGSWGPAYGTNLCFADRTLTQQRTCHYINGNPFTQTQSVIETISDRCTQNPGIPCYWTTTSYGPWICDPADVNNKRRIKNESLICTNYNGTTFVSQTRSINYDISVGGNQAPVANFAWWPSYRTITLDVKSFSSDPDGTISKITVNWGDGVVDEYINSPSLGLLQHTYDNPNPSAPVVKPVSVTVTDDCGRVSVPNTQQISTASKQVYNQYKMIATFYANDWQETSTNNTDAYTGIEITNSRLTAHYGLFLGGHSEGTFDVKVYKTSDNSLVFNSVLNKKIRRN